MNNYKSTTLAGLALCALASSAAQAADFTENARVLAAEPIYSRITEPHQECRTDTVTETQPAQRGVGGALIGGAAGGLLGNQVGKGGGKTAATVVGVIAGGLIGDHVQNGDNQPQTVQRDVQRCRDVSVERQVVDGYRVTYRYGGRDVTTTMPYDPGRTVRVGVGVILDNGGDPRYDDRR